MKLGVIVVAIIGVFFYSIGSVLAIDSVDLKSAIGITLMFVSLFLFGGITAMELIRQKTITIED